MSERAQSDDEKIVNLADAFKNPDKKIKGRKKDAPPPPPPTGGPPADEPGIPSELPPDCPVKALGTLEGDYFVLDSLGQLRRKKEGELGRLPIISLFGGPEYLQATWPTWEEVDGRWVRKKKFDPGRPAEALIKSCSLKGVWDPTNRVRGCGSWIEDSGDLVMHCGAHLWRSGGASAAGVMREEAGMQGDLLYPRRPPLPEPEFKGLEKVGETILTQLETWNFKRGEFDRLCVLGEVTAMKLGQAAPWRPMMWVQGAKGTGKSTALEFIETLLGERAAVKPAATSQAYVYQTIGDSSLPVLLDEFEAKEDNKRVQDVIELMRIAASGGELGRGGSDNNPRTYTLKSCFAAFSILMPPLTAQDRSRMVIIEMAKLRHDEDAAEFRFDTPDDHHQALGSKDKWKLVGRQLSGRVLRQWPRYRQTYRAYFMALNKLLHDPRTASQFGALGAAQDIARFDKLELANVEAWVALIQEVGLAETTGYLNEPEGCLQYLLACQTDEHRHGARETISHYLRQAQKQLVDKTQTNDPDDAARVLARCGIKVYPDPARIGGEGQPVTWVFISSTHPALLEFFRNTHWKGRAGSAGAFAQALRGLVGAAKAKEMKIDGAKHWGTPIMWEGIFPPESAGDEKRERET